MIYMVRDWDRLFETSETRKRKFLSWVLVPNTHDSLGFCTLMTRPDGLEVFAVWNLVLQLASRCTIRGTLASGKGKPYTPQDISTMVRAPVEKVEPALAILIDVGWLESATLLESSATSWESSPDTWESSPDTLESHSATSGMKKERKKERKNPPTPTDDNGGDLFFPESLNTPEFKKAWSAWCEYLSESGKPLVPARAKAQLEELSEGGAVLAVERLKTALMRNWQAPAHIEGRTINTTMDPAVQKIADEAARINKESKAN